MKNYYSTKDSVVMTFSDIEVDINEFEHIHIRFERPTDKGFDFSEWTIPGAYNTKSFGFSEDEIFDQERYIINNQPLIWKLAKEVSFDA